jgi:hypothetical protein
MDEKQAKRFPAATRALGLAGCLLFATGAGSIGFGDPLVVSDAYAEAWLSDAALDSGKAYLAVRGLNAAVSVLKGSEFEVHPLGVGVSAAAGEVLDPLDDMTERLADLLVYSTATVGVYRLLQPMVVVVSGFGMQVMLLALGLGLVTASWRRSRRGAPEPRLDALNRALALVALVLLGLRVATPAAAGLGEIADARYLTPAEREAIEVLRAGTPDISRLTAPPAERPDSGWLSGIGEVGARAIDGASQMATALDTLIRNSDPLLGALLTLFTLALTRLVLNAFILPLGCVWATWMLARALVRSGR